MSENITVTRGASFPGLKSISESLVYPCDNLVGDSVVVPAGASNVHIVLAFPTNSKLQVIGLSSDQTVSIKTNSTSTPLDTFTLTGKKSITWTKDDVATVPNPPVGGGVGTAITDIYVSNAGITDASFQIGAGYNN